LAARDSIGLTPWPLVVEAERRTIERVQALLPSDEFAVEIASSRSQTLRDALTQGPADPRWPRVGGDLVTTMPRGYDRDIASPAASRSTWDTVE
jgi:hypothetical protein